jgi:hypothetical protein
MGLLVSVSRRFGMKDELHESGAVAQIDEDQAAVIAPPVDPAGHAGLRAGPLRGQLATPAVAV